MPGNAEPGAVWQPYGLAGDPFFTAPLQMLEDVTHGIHLFQGDARRAKAERIVQRVLNSDSSVRLIEGPNNIDQAVLQDPRRTGDLFGTVRDLFQLRGFHFLLCASEGFRLRSLKDRQNLLDVLGTPTRPEPLSRNDIIQVMGARYEDLRMPDAAVTPPMMPEHFADLYEVFGGELRGALEVAGQVFKEELGPTGTPRQLDARDVIADQRPLVQDLLEDLTEVQLRVLKAVRRLAGDGDVRQADLVKDLEGRGVAQGTISVATDVLAANQWLSIDRPNARATFYRLGGRARIIEDGLA